MTFEEFLKAVPSSEWIIKSTWPQYPDGTALHIGYFGEGYKQRAQAEPHPFKLVEVDQVTFLVRGNSVTPVSEPKPEQGEQRKPMLMSAENPNGWKLEDLLAQLSYEITEKSMKLLEDERPQATMVAANNAEIVMLLSQAASAQHNSLRVLSQLGPDQGPLGKPRIGIGSAA